MATNFHLLVASSLKSHAHDGLPLPRRKSHLTRAGGDDEIVLRLPRLRSPFAVRKCIAIALRAGEGL
jgi:hypothetical protein